MGIDRLAILKKIATDIDDSNLLSLSLNIVADGILAGRKQRWTNISGSILNPSNLLQSFFGKLVGTQGLESQMYDYADKRERGARYGIDAHNKMLDYIRSSVISSASRIYNSYFKQFVDVCGELNIGSDSAIIDDHNRLIESAVDSFKISMKSSGVSSRSNIKNSIAECISVFIKAWSGIEAKQKSGLSSIFELVSYTKGDLSHISRSKDELSALLSAILNFQLSIDMLKKISSSNFDLDDDESLKTKTNSQETATGPITGSKNRCSILSIRTIPAQPWAHFDARFNTIAINLSQASNSDLKLVIMLGCSKKGVSSTDLISDIVENYISGDKELISIDDFTISHFSTSDNKTQFILTIRFELLQKLALDQSSTKHLTFKLNDKNFMHIKILKQITKTSQTSSTAPLYITKSPSGKDVIFSPSDIVRGGGSLSDGAGKFKPKKWKPYSLANIVNSPSFGKGSK